MYTKLKYLTYFSLIALLFTGCSKDDNDESAVAGLVDTTWVATMTDDNPGTNPPVEEGGNVNNTYYQWKDCQMDDSFVFIKDRLTVDGNGTACEDGAYHVFNTGSGPYSYDPETKRLEVKDGEGVFHFDVYELNKDRLKLGTTFYNRIGSNTIIFLFKRK